jgi:hypothetical protein
MSPTASPRRAPEREHRPPLRVLGSHGEAYGPSAANAAADAADTLQARASTPRRPALRLLTQAHEEASASAHAGAAVLLVGADARRRAALRVELGRRLPSRTRFAEADDVAEVLEHACSSRMVILAGDLEDADTESLMRLLGQRHPELPVISVEEPLPAALAGNGL